MWRWAALVTTCLVVGTGAHAQAPAAPSSAANSAGGVAAAPPWTALRAGIDSLLNDPAFANAHWGVLIVDPLRGDTLYARNAGKLFMPASNQKILTGAVALAKLGAEYRWTTVLAARGRVRAGTLSGDLLVFGSGDPSMSDAVRGDVRAAFDSLADAVRAAGVERITGRLVHAGDALPGDTYGYGWAHDDFDEPYSAPVDELFVNEGIARVIVRAAARAGRAATVDVLPAMGVVPVRVQVRSTAAPVAPSERPTISFDDGAYVVRGQLSVRDSAVFTVAIRDPARAWLAALRAALVRRGVRVSAQFARDTARDAARDTLVRWSSPPLSQLLGALEKPSQNQLAELFFRTLGGAFDSAATARAGRRVVTTQLAQWGVDTTHVAVRDGSGLSRHDYLAPDAVVRVLDVMGRSADSALFRASLPVAGVDGTLINRLRGTTAQGRVQAKTGTLDKARSLSGYVTTAGGATLLFSLLANNWTTSVRAVERVQDAIVLRLAVLPLTVPVDADRR